MHLNVTRTYIKSKNTIASIRHSDAFYGLKWRIWRAKMYFIRLKLTNEK